MHLICLAACLNPAEHEAGMLDAVRCECEVCAGAGPGQAGRCQPAFSPRPARYQVHTLPKKGACLPSTCKLRTPQDMLAICRMTSLAFHCVPHICKHLCAIERS